MPGRRRIIIHQNDFSTHNLPLVVVVIIIVVIVRVVITTLFLFLLFGGRLLVFLILVIVHEVVYLHGVESDIDKHVLAELGELKTAQAEKLAEGFRFLAVATQEALRASREEQAVQLNRVQHQVEQRLEAIQKSTEDRLEQIRHTVDEKLHEALEKRLGESFNLVAQRLEQVQKGLGEMQNLAIGVGSLQRVLTNVKTRGIFGEVQLEALLEQVLTPGNLAQVQPGQGSPSRP